MSGAPKPAPAGNQQKLITSIIDGLKPMMDTMTADTAAQFAEVMVTLATIAVRLEVIEKGNATAPAKRPARGERKTGGAAGAGAGAANDAPKLNNARLFTRWMWAHDEAFRAKFETDEVKEAILADPKVTKEAEGTEKRFFAEGLAFWGSTDKPTQDEIRALFGQWKEELERNALEPNLDADKGEAAGAGDDAELGAE